MTKQRKQPAPVIRCRQCQSGTLWGGLTDEAGRPVVGCNRCEFVCTVDQAAALVVAERGAVPRVSQMSKATWRAGRGDRLLYVSIVVPSGVRRAVRGSLGRSGFATPEETVAFIEEAIARRALGFERVAVARKRRGRAA